NPYDNHYNKPRNKRKKMGQYLVFLFYKKVELTIKTALVRHPHVTQPRPSLIRPTHVTQLMVLIPDKVF
uniref:hypothetical protein n=1 Tax=Bartonella sp. AC329YNZD TaxID=3243452 RepID=UPI0035D04686